MKKEILECIEEVEGNLLLITLDIDNNDTDKSTQDEISQLENQLENIKKILNGTE